MCCNLLSVSSDQLVNANGQGHIRKWQAELETYSRDQSWSRPPQPYASCKEKLCFTYSFKQGQNMGAHEKSSSWVLPKWAKSQGLIFYNASLKFCRPCRVGSSVLTDFWPLFCIHNMLTGLTCTGFNIERRIHGKKYQLKLLKNISQSMLVLIYWMMKNFATQFE